MKSKKIIWIGLIIVIFLLILNGILIYRLFTVKSIPTNLSEECQSVACNGEEIASLGKRVSDIYSNDTYSNGKKTDCLDLYLTSIEEQSEFNITKACPIIAKGMDFSKINYGPKGIEEFLVLNEFINNPSPIVKHLIDHKGDLSPEYRSLYSKFILSQYVKHHSSDSNGLDNYYGQEILMQGVDYHGIDPFQVEILSVTPNIDLVLVADIPSSGAYNIYNSLSKVTFTYNDIKVAPFNNIIDTTIKDISLIKEQPIESGDYRFVNSWFNYGDWTLNIYGMKPFGLYLCSINSKYAFYGDRLILVSQTQARDCKTFDMEQPQDIPEDFDTTQVEIYKISPEILERAINLKI